MSNHSQHKIIGGFNRRELWAATWIYNFYYPTVFTLVKKLTGDDCLDTKDLVNDAFLKLLKSSTRFDRMSRIRSFLFNITKNLCHDFLANKEIIRNKLSEWDLIAQTEPVEWDVKSHELFMSQVEMALQQLTLKQQQLFRLSYFEGLSNDQVAARLQVSSKTIANSKIIVLNNVKSILAKSGLLVFINIFL